jgi:hypothetical protein
VIAGLLSIRVLNNTLRIHVPWNDANWNVFASGTFKELPVSGLDHTYTLVGAGVPSMGFGKENKSSIAQSPQLRLFVANQDARSQGMLGHALG